ncbi:MAG: hypothetical protein DBX61_09450 [Clostridiales bacterium]|nr:MAG: hypothetical protein DBX61_09450 [Clostridiales bacterium]
MQVKVMTFNIRYDTLDDGINCFEGRKKLIKEFFAQNKPDVIGFQEVLPHVKQWLQQQLSDYVVLGTGRNADYTGEGVTIAYRKDRFDLAGFEQFWLSNTPNVPGSRFPLDQSPCPRITSAATLVCKTDGKTFAFINTHLDHYGEFAKVCGATVLMNRIASLRKHGFVLTGDFNAFPGDNAIRQIKSVRGVHDLTAAIKESTFHGYGTVKKICKIDYIFSDRPAVKDTLVLHKDSSNGIFLSDHYPVSVDVNI